MFNEEHLREFLRLHREQPVGEPPTRIPQVYWRNFPDRSLCSHTHTRETLRTYCARTDVNDEQRMLTVIAWGRARALNRERIYERRNQIVDVMGYAREAKCPTNAYRLYQKAIIKGLGPAFWTKLIHFCEPSGRGYILDQFTGKSSDLLKARPIGLIVGNYVHRRAVDESKYEAFCGFVRELAVRMSEDQNKAITPEVAEVSMYAGPGHPWRRYVQRHWPIQP